MTPERWKQIDELAQAALERGGAERATFLDNACAGDDTLRSEVESQIAYQQQASRFLEEPAFKHAAELVANPETESVEGRTISHYRILHKLGEGGMGEVYLALDTKLDRNVALKILPADVVAHQESLRRFVQEAKAASALNHPNIITIYEFDEFAGSPATRQVFHFIAIEFIDGETLRGRMQNGPMKLPEVLAVAAQVASALTAAHEAGIVHRDIKPENMMLRRDGIVKVLDFGLAKLTQKSAPVNDTQAATVSPIHTEPGRVMGTVAYMSPEQLRGSDIDARTDIWSLGVVLYEMLAGQTPFGGETISHIGFSILENEPVPIAHYAPQSPAELQRIVRKALAKDRDDRYQTVRDLLTDLKNLSRELEVQSELERSQPGAANKANAQKKASDASRRVTASGETRLTYNVARVVSSLKHNKLAAAFTLLLTIAVTAAGLWWYLNSRTTALAINSIAVLPFSNDSGSSDIEYLSDGMTESLISILAQFPRLSVKSRSSVFRYKGKDIGPQEAGSQLGVQASLNARVVQRGDNLTLSLELADARTGNQIWGQPYNRKTTDLASLSSDMARDVLETLGLRLTNEERQRLTKRDTQNTEAYRAYLKGREWWNKGLGPGYEKSRDYFQQAIDLDPSYSQAYSGLADYYGITSSLGLLPPGEGWPKTEAAANKALALDETLAEPHNPLAAVKLYYARDWPAAERHFLRGIDLDPNYGEIHIHYGLSLTQFGRGDEALEQIQLGLQLEPDSVHGNEILAKSLFFMRQYDRAIDQYRKTLELDPNYPPAHEWLGYAYEQKGLQKEAVAELSKALVLVGAGGQASSLENTYATSGYDAAVRGLAQQRLAGLNERVKRGEYVPAHEYVTAYTRMGETEKAIAWLDKAADERNALVIVTKVSPIYDKLRSDPRFSDLLRLAGLTQ